MKRAWETRQVPAVCHISVLDAVLTKNSHKTCLALLSCPLLCDRDCAFDEQIPTSTGISQYTAPI